MTTEEVMKVALRDKDYYETSGGGVTASGGEILTQAEFVADIFRSCREAGIHTCADTSGYGPREAMEKILECSDLVYFDLKHMDPREHARMAGKTNDFIMQNLKAVVEKKIPIVIRTPLIPGYNDSTENIEALCETVTGMNAGASIHILPYHKFGIGKYRAIDKQYELETLEPPGVETIDRVKGIIEAKGLKCEISK
jgi:pyruvate formate lyase activating enzyme